MIYQLSSPFLIRAAIDRLKLVSNLARNDEHKGNQKGIFLKSCRDMSLTPQDFLSFQVP